MVIYADPSSFIKLWLAETDCLSVRAALQSRETVVACSALGRVEMTSALKRARLGKRLTHAQHSRLQSELSLAWQRVLIVSVTDVLIGEASDLALRFGLRAYDAVHLASVVDLARRGAQPTVMSFDTELIRAAGAIGIECWESS